MHPSPPARRHRSVAAALVLSSVVPLAACSASATVDPDPAADGRHAATPIGTAVVAWEHAPGGAPGLLAADARGVVVATGREIVALSHDGAQQWRAAIDDASSRWPAIDRARVAVLTRPSEAGSGEVVVLDRSTGDVAWRGRLGGDGAAVALGASTVFASSTDGSVVARRAVDGALRWRAHLDGVLAARGALVVDERSATVATVVRRGGQVLLALLDATTGADRGGLELGPPSAGEASSVAALGPGRLAVGTTWGEVVAVDLVGRAVTWATPLGLRFDAAAHLAVGDGLVVAAAVDDTVVALDAATGAVRWRASVGAPLLAVRPVLVGGTVAIAAFGGAVFLLDGHDGAARPRPATGGATAALAAAADRLYGAVRLAAPDRVVAWDLRSGAPSGASVPEGPPGAPTTLPANPGS